MGQAFSGTSIKKNILYDFVVRLGVCLVTTGIHLSLFWDESPILLASIALFQALLYPFAMLFWQKKTDAKSTRFSLAADTFLYGLCQGAWGLNPLLIAIYVSSANAINMAAGGLQFCFKNLLLFLLGMFVASSVAGFYFRLDIPIATTIISVTGLVFFLTAFGFRVFQINSNLRFIRNNLRTKTDELESLNHLALAVNSHLEIDILLKNIMQAIERIYPFEALYIVRFDEEEDIVEVSGIYGSDITVEELKGFKELEFDTKRDKNSIFVRSLVNRKVAYIPEISPQLVQSAAYIDRQLFGVKPSVSLIYLPVYVRDKVVAGAAFINYYQNFYLEQFDIDRIQAFLIQVGTAIRNATLFRELTTAKVEAEQARSKAEASEEAKGRFLANMSHEIRTPLTAIMGYAEALQEDNPSKEEREKFVDYILRSGKHLLSMINDILDISKIEASKIEVERISCNYLELIYEIDCYLNIKSKEKGIDYQLNIKYPIPRTIVTDPTRLKQILFNLCNNAVKFTDNGSIVFNVHTNNQFILFSVVDSGIGIDDQELNKIFSAFDQADSSTTRIYGGTGLGLYISKSLAELLDGELTVESVKGVGSTFVIKIPYIHNVENCIEKEDEFKALLSDIKQSRTVEGIPSLNGKVLLAEDNIDNQKLITRLVQQAGLEIEAVGNGEAAVDATSKNTYDLILMDMQMPIMGGKEAANIIKRNGITTPIVAFTANVMKHQIDEYQELGFAEVLEKPIVRQKLFDTLTKVLRSEAGAKSNNVLIVEDNDVNQLILYRYITKANPTAKISISKNGEEAVNLVKSEKFDLVLMDMEMPVMGGLEATKQIRALGADMPIYIVTGNIGKDTVNLCLDAGASGHIAKPVDKEIILKTIRKALDAPLYG